MFSYIVYVNLIFNESWRGMFSLPKMIRWTCVDKNENTKKTSFVKKGTF